MVLSLLTRWPAGDRSLEKAGCLRLPAFLSLSRGGQSAFLGISELVNLSTSAGAATVATVLLGHRPHVWALPPVCLLCPQALGQPVSKVGRIPL